MPRNAARREHARASLLDEPVEAVLETDDLDAVVDAGLHDGADHGVQAGCVAAAGQDADACDGPHWIQYSKRRRPDALRPKKVGVLD